MIPYILQTNIVKALHCAYIDNIDKEHAGKNTYLDTVSSEFNLVLTEK